MRIDTTYHGLPGIWRAWDDPEGIYGEGKTEQEAIADFMVEYLEAVAHDDTKYREALMEMASSQMEKDRERIKELEAEVERLTVEAAERDTCRAEYLEER